MGEISEDIKVKNLLQPRPGGCWNLQVTHGLFNAEGEHLVLPKNTTFYTTIIREPLAQFQSAFYFFGEQYRQKNQYDGRLTQAQLMEKYLVNNKIFPTDDNSPAVDLGWKRFADKFRSTTSMQDQMDAFIAFLDVEFDFVMLSERIDESLVMLKEYMGWELRDILYLSRNVLRKNTKGYVSEKTKRTILDHLTLDKQIYDHFSASFERHIDKLGRARIAGEVHKFRVLREEFENKCLNKSGGLQQMEWHSFSYPLTNYGKTENFACSFLQTNDMVLDRAVTQLQLSRDYAETVRGRATFDLQGVIMKLQYEHETRYVRELEKGIEV